MPYVNKERRKDLDKIVDAMKDVKVDGDLNYILFKFCKNYVSPKYNNYKNFIGELNETVAEVRRRFLAPHEDIKIKENGDVN